MITDPSDPIDIVKEKGWLKINDMDQLSVLCKQLIAKNADKVNFFLIQVIRFVNLVYRLLIY